MACIFYNKPCVFFRGGKPQKKYTAQIVQKTYAGMKFWWK